MAQQVFWQRKRLSEMNPTEWESLCDGCGQCCLHKLEDEDTGDFYYSCVACKLLDVETASCKDYSHRKQLVPACLQLTLADVAEFHWLPNTCAYRLMAEGKGLPDWHPLVSGDPKSVAKAGFSIAGQVISETELSQQEMDENLEEYIIHWVQ